MKTILTTAIIGLAGAFVSCTDSKLPWNNPDYISAIQSNTDWYDAANKSTAFLIDYFWRDNGNYFGADVWWDTTINPKNDASGQITVPNSYGTGFEYWPQAHAMDVVIDAYLRTGDSKYSAYFMPWITGIKSKNGGTYNNDFYDDEQWNALTILRIYNILKKEGKTADATTAWEAEVILWNRIRTADNGLGGGGLAWKHSAPYSRMACSNGPGCLLAMKLYNTAVSEGKTSAAADYLSFAKNTYSWMTTYLCDISTGQVYDNLSINQSTPNDPKTWSVDKVALSYNQGTFMASAAELYKATGDEVYLRNAVSFASYQVNKKTGTNYPVFNGEGSGDNYLFRGVFVRYFLELIQTDGLSETVRKKYINSLINNSETLWLNAHDNNEYFWGGSWSEAPTVDEDGIFKILLKSQTAGCTLVEARAAYELWLNAN